MKQKQPTEQIMTFAKGATLLCLEDKNVIIPARISVDVSVAGCVYDGLE